MQTHAGCVVYRPLKNEPLFLIVASSDGNSWVLPKGHIEEGELMEETALRELREEAGVIGEIVGKISTQHFMKSDESVVVQYFLVRECGNVEPQEVRSIRWENEGSARELLSFDDAKTVLEEAAAIIQRNKIENEQ